MKEYIKPEIKNEVINIDDIICFSVGDKSSGDTGFWDDIIIKK